MVMKAQKCVVRCNVDTDFRRMRFLKKVVETAVSLYHKGLTLKAVKKCVLEFFGLVVSTTSIWKWCQRFAKQISGIIHGLADLLHCDETLLKTHQEAQILLLLGSQVPED